MLSAFILGLALGGLWVRRRIDSIGSPAVISRLGASGHGLVRLLRYRCTTLALM